MGTCENHLIKVVLTNPTIFVWGKNKANISNYHLKMTIPRDIKVSIILQRHVILLTDPEKEGK